MSRIFSKITSSVQQLYQRAEDLIEEERDFSVSQNLLNATFKKYVTDNVDLLKDLHADVYDDWLRLYATVDVVGIYAALSVDLKLVQMEFNKGTQLVVFEQISKTQVIEARFDKMYKKLGANFALFVFQKVLDKDPLGPILQHYNIVQVKHGLLYLDLNRWLGDIESVMRTLRKVHINHGILKETELVLLANVNLDGIFNRDKQDNIFDDFELEDDGKTTISPIKD
ncbi:hypothetical protein GCM10023206_00310 [Acinetobacter puyangensis]|uniref:Uncharacterized protein n=1 Tax=Acinetobacter puyangensis TaxID=1096779 RepID=A0A240E8S2_9GAMM|nr:hypothetical protein [Acinetobacter puyangensis]SNX44619.1 hypothetical protein SAMN05421731_103361 [Acinetobacter puyangensis]